MQNHNNKHFDKAVELLDNFPGKELLQHYLKKYFAANKKHGSKDRKSITHLCYIYFRIGINLKDSPTKEKLQVAVFLCEKELQNWSGILPEKWLDFDQHPTSGKFGFIQSQYADFSVEKLFPFSEFLSNNIDKTAFALSFLEQPNMFVRIRPNKENEVKKKLGEAQIAYTQTIGNCLAFANSPKIDSVLKVNQDIVIQDISSQKIGNFLDRLKENYHNGNPIKIWDACAASGGKSILAKDIFQKINLTVSDIRPAILNNLKTRFKEAGIQNYKSFIADLSKPISQKEKYDLVICDAPCTGSGTWSRTPEMVSSFDINSIDKFQTLQKSIVANCAFHLNESGYFLYITCSVFKQENEDVANFIETNLPLKCVSSGEIFGYAHKGDSMFAALFTLKK